MKERTLRKWIATAEMLATLREIINTPMAMMDAPFSNMSLTNKELTSGLYFAKTCQTTLIALKLVLSIKSKNPR